MGRGGRSSVLLPRPRLACSAGQLHRWEWWWGLGWKLWGIEVPFPLPPVSPPVPVATVSPIPPAIHTCPVPRGRSSPTVDRLVRWEWVMGGHGLVGGGKRRRASFVWSTLLRDVSTFLKAVDKGVDVRHGGVGKERALFPRTKELQYALTVPDCTLLMSSPDKSSNVMHCYTPLHIDAK